MGRRHFGAVRRLPSGRDQARRPGGVGRIQLGGHAYPRIWRSDPSQASHILPGGLAEVARLMTGKAVDADHIVPEVHVADDDIDRVAREINDLETELSRVSDALTARRRRLVTDLHQRGHTLRDIGVIVHLSHQRVAQLVAQTDSGSRSS